MMHTHIATLALTLSLLGGCAGNPTVENATRSANRNLEREHAPIRLVSTPTGKRSVLVRPAWAGVTGASITANAPVVRDDILASFARHCGFDAAQLVETRVVRHRPPEFYEVWVFKDARSQRRDGLSGVSVLMRQLPHGGGVDFSFHGGCHSPAEREFHFN